jgi:hypothetical protein
MTSIAKQFEVDADSIEVTNIRATFHRDHTWQDQVANFVDRSNVNLEYGDEVHIILPGLPITAMMIPLEIYKRTGRIPVVIDLYKTDQSDGNGNNTLLYSGAYSYIGLNKYDVADQEVKKECP